MTAIATRPDIEEIVRIHDEAIRLYGVAFEKLADASKAVGEARAMERRISPNIDQNSYSSNHNEEINRFHNILTMQDRSEYLDVAKRLLKLKTWAYLMERTNLEMLMDKEAKDKLRKQMAYVAPKANRYGEIVNQADLDAGMPDISVGNIEATLDGFMADSVMIWQRGIANVFSKLDRRFRSHDGFKIGSRIILTHVFNEFGGWNYRNAAEDSLIDIERIFYILEGEKPPMQSYAGAIGSIREIRNGVNGARQDEVETRFFRVRIFKNGNAHLWFKDKELMVKVNKILAEYYGEVIGDGQQAEEDPFENIKHTPAKRYGFFPTPDKAADDVFKRVNLTRKIDEPRMRILEPSAGTGNLARRCVDGHKSLENWSGGREDHAHKYHARNLVDVVELQQNLAEDLKAEGIYNRVYAMDFLKLDPGTTGLYDLIVMNPPFDRGRDIDHVMHARKFLQPNGTLVAIMSAGTEFRSDKKSIAFQKFIEEMKGHFFDLPAGSFSESGTNVNTCIVKFHANKHKVERWQ